MSNVGEGASLDFAVLAIGFAEKDGGRGVAIGDGSDVHAYIIWQHMRLYKHYIALLHAYKDEHETTQRHQNKEISLFMGQNFGLKTIDCPANRWNWPLMVISGSEYVRIARRPLLGGAPFPNLRRGVAA